MSLSARLAEFLEGNHVLSLATAAAGQSYSAPVYYLFLSQEVAFVFLSDSGSRHARDALINPECSASVYANADDPGGLQGAQILGSVIREGSTLALSPEAALVYSAYLRRYPVAVGLQSELWRLKANWIKFTDNPRGFGFKEVWVRQ